MKQTGQLLTATVLPHDTYGRDSGLLIDQRLPGVLGNNVAGVVEQLGPVADSQANTGIDFQIGDRVFGISSDVEASSDQAGLQEYAILNTNAIAHTPESFTDEQVASLPINLVTSAAVLFTKTGFDMPAPYMPEQNFDYAKASIVIVGGGTNVGQLSVQLASIANIGKIITTAGPASNDRLKSMGATHVIDRHLSSAEIAKQVEAAIGVNNVTQAYFCAPLNVDLAVALLSKDKPSTLKLLLPLEGNQEQELTSQLPLCKFGFVDDLTNASLAPNTVPFWAKVPDYLRRGELLPTDFRIIHGLDKVDDINNALDQYRDFARADAQTIVKIWQ